MSGPDPDHITANVLLADGSQTRPDRPRHEDFGEFKATLRTLSVIFPDRERSSVSIIDLGCLEGGYSFAFARAGYQCLGLEARQINYDKCEWIRQRAGLDNVSFVRDDVRNLARYGTFDVVFCSGLLYHMEDPVPILRLLADCSRKVLILNTHYTTRDMTPVVVARHGLSERVELDGVPGRYQKEHDPDATPDQIERSIWASWGNDRAFWMDKRYLLQTLRNVGFDAVYEQFDFLEDLTTDDYIEMESRSMFVAVKTAS